MGFFILIMRDDMTNWPRQAECNAYYGDPDPDRDGRPNRAWEDANLVTIAPPYPMVLAWDVSAPVRGIRVHRRCAESLTRVLRRIAAIYPAAADRERARVHLFGGSYSFRLMRGGARLSMHSWGCAIDLDPQRNGLGVPWRPERGMMPVAVVEAFEAEGWVAGARWRTADAMHFQAARV